MIDPEIQKYVQDQLAQMQNKALYTTTNAAFHLHNGIDSPELPKLEYIILGTGTTAVQGIDNYSAAKGTLYINTTAGTAATRLFINTDGGTTWASFTASA